MPRKSTRTSPGSIRIAPRGISLFNRSDDFAAIAVQGPQAPQVSKKFSGRAWDGTRNRVLKLDDGVYIAMTGYTGEIGFEVLAPAASAATYWDKLSAAGARPCGLGSRDTLRLEMCYPLNGSDLSPERTPLEAGLRVLRRLGEGLSRFRPAP